MPGREKTTKTPKIVENISNYQGFHISKDSGSMFVRQLDICFYIVDKVVKQKKK